MRSGPQPKGPRLWLQPERIRSDGKPNEPAVWVIRDDGRSKRSTGFGAADRERAEQALATYIARKHQPQAGGNGDTAQTLTADVLAVFARDVVPTYSRPKETASRIRRLLTWWSQPAHAMRTMTEMGRPVVRMTGHISDIKTATCQAYAEHVGAPRSASIDLELLRAAINHFAAEEQLPWKVHVWRPEKSLPRERWLTRSEVARLIWLAWRRRRSQDETEDEWAVWKHLARWMVMAHYTGTRKTAILKASFKRQLGFGYIDIESGLWYRLAEGTRPTKKRQPPARLPLPLIGHLRRWKKNGQTYVVEFHGKPIDRIDKAFRKLVSESELDGKIVPHTFRHTAITWGMQRGMDPWDASGYFGIDLKTLTEVYGHHHPDHLQEAAAAMARPGKVRAAK